MAQPRLRVYYGPDDNTRTPLASDTRPQGAVTVPLRDVFSWLLDACHSGRTWLRDFEDDEVTISSDLHEVILAYQHFRRPSA